MARSGNKDFGGVNRISGLPSAIEDGDAVPLLQLLALSNIATKTFASVATTSGSMGSFQPIIFPTKISDDFGHYNETTGLYTCSRTGLYLITSTIRPSDSSPAGTNFGIGVHTANVDGPWFLWHSIQSTIGSGRRTSYPYIRLERFTKGQQLRMFTYADENPLTILNAGMQITCFSD